MSGLITALLSQAGAWLTPSADSKLPGIWPQSWRSPSPAGAGRLGFVPGFAVDGEEWETGLD